MADSFGGILDTEGESAGGQGGLAMTDTITLESDKMSDADRGELRAYLQRGETRLSTLHRVAGTFLGGAGLLTLLPVLFRDAFSTLLSRILFLENSLFPARGAFSRTLLLVPVVLSMLLPLWALYLLIRDLVGFYFTAHHFGARQQGITYPRFILSGIRVPEGTLTDIAALERARRAPAVMDLLVPASSESRARLLREAQHVGECKGLDVAHDPPALVGNALQQFVFSYTASNLRSLAEESAKMEASLARHDLLLRVLVLRYAKRLS